MKKKEEHKHEVYDVEVMMCNAYCKCGATHSIMVFQNEKGYFWEISPGEKWHENIN